MCSSVQEERRRRTYYIQYMSVSNGAYPEMTQQDARAFCGSDQFGSVKRPKVPPPPPLSVSSPQGERHASSSQYFQGKRKHEDHKGREKRKQAEKSIRDARSWKREKITRTERQGRPDHTTTIKYTDVSLPLYETSYDGL